MNNNNFKSYINYNITKYGGLILFNYLINDGLENYLKTNCYQPKNNKLYVKILDLNK